MRKIISGKRFSQCFDRPFLRWWPRELCSIDFVDCVFENCALSVTENPRLRTTVRDISITRCEAHSCSLRTAILEDIVVEELKSDRLSGHGAVYKHVTLKGNIETILINPKVAGGRVSSKVQALFDKANLEYYSSVDWAIDISRASFFDADIRGVPAKLIRRDPATQVVVKRKKVIDRRWERLDLSATHWPTSIEFLLADTYEDVVLIAPKLAPEFDDLVKGLRLLQEAGIAEPD